MACKDSAEDSRLPALVRERLRIVDERAVANAAAITERIGPERLARYSARLQEILRSDDPVWIRLRALYALADEQLAFTAGHVACQRGCAHCCYTAVPLARPEAEMLGMQLKRKPERVATRIEFSGIEWGYHNPCPFLENKECTIYADRPFACRIHFSVDHDGLLCELTSTVPQPVPYLNMTAYQLAYVLITGGGLADIRDYWSAG